MSKAQRQEGQDSEVQLTREGQVRKVVVSYGKGQIPHVQEKLGLHTVRKPNLHFFPFNLTCLYIETSGQSGRGVACHTIGCIPL